MAEILSPLFLPLVRQKYLSARQKTNTVIHALFSACLLVSSWCLLSSRSKYGMAFVCADSAVRTVRAHQYFTMVAS